MSGLTAWHSPLPDSKPRLELYVWSLIEDARRGRVCALMPMTGRPDLAESRKFTRT